MPDRMDCIRSFALYRLPGQHEPQLIIQTEDEPLCLADYHLLNGHQGFVMAPFCIRPNSPLVIIKPHIQAEGWDKVNHHLPALKACVEAYCANRNTENTDAPLPETQEATHYHAVFKRFMEALSNGTFDKLVLARRHVVAQPQHFDAFHLFQQACQLYPQLMVYLSFSPLTGCWLGCTPELLLKSSEAFPHTWETISLAGTQAIAPGTQAIAQTGTQAIAQAGTQAIAPGSTPQLTWNEKNKTEQQLVTQFIENKLQPMAHTLQKEGPCTTQAGPVAHLMTQFRFTLNPNVQAGDVVQALHPTPAVCGLPVEEARQFIHTHEDLDRSYYAGFMGPFNLQGQTSLYVNLRCMQIMPHALCLYAGGGILQNSTLESEWNETKQKMQTLKNLLPHV